MSNFRLAQLEACMKLRRIDVVQYGWNMFDRRMAREIFPWCTANGVGVMAYGSLAYGMLSGTFRSDMKFDEADWRSKRGTLGGLNLFRTLFGPDHFARNLRAVEELKAMAAKYGKTLPQFALRWTLSQPAIHTGLVGFRRPAEVEENLGALGFTISPEDMAAIDAIFARNDAVTEPTGWLEDDPPPEARNKGGCTMPFQRFAPMTKTFATFDCDAHVTEPPLIWERAAEFLTRDEMDALRSTIWWDGESQQLIVNGRAGVGIGSSRRGGIPGTMRVISNAGPGVKHDIQRALNVRNLKARRR